MPLVYPVRAGAVFFHGNTDHMAGNPLNDPTFTAFNSAGVAAGSWTFFAGFWRWAAPTVRGRYRIRAKTSHDVIGYADVDVLKRFFTLNDVNSGLPCPTVWYELPVEYPTKEQIFDDEAADYNQPYDAPVRRWRIEWTGKLRQAQAQVLDDFYDEHRGYALPFYFYDHRKDVLYDNVRFAKDKYTRNHRQLWAQTRTMELIRRPV